MVQIFIVICGIFIVGLIVLGSLASKLYDDNISLRDQISSYTKELGKEKKKNTETMPFKKGGKAIMPNWNLVYNQGEPIEKKFKVTYEVDITDVSSDKVKVKATNVIGEDSVGNDPKNRAGILSIMQEKWVNKSLIEIVVDDSMRRDAKLQELLGEDN